MTYHSRIGGKTTKTDGTFAGPKCLRERGADGEKQIQVAVCQEVMIGETSQVVALQLLSDETADLFEKAYEGLCARLIGNNKRINEERRKTLTTEQQEKEKDAARETIELATKHALEFSARPIGKRDENGDVQVDVPDTPEAEKRMRRRDAGRKREMEGRIKDMREAIADAMAEEVCICICISGCGCICGCACIYVCVRERAQYI